MDYMAKNPETRRDIRNWWEPAKSVLICAFSYSSNEKTVMPFGHGRIARYVGREDYHPVLKEKMEALKTWLKTTIPSADAKIFADTSPVLERLYGRYAGIGWIGKNTMLLSQKIGSYFFLAGMAINIDLPHETPEMDHCGTCRRCIEACPTQAFPQERVLDANRCISYFTIEHRGDIPDDFKPKIDNWIFGCDICQEVCPFNRFSEEGSIFNGPRLESLNLKETLHLSPEKFKSRFSKTALARSKHAGLTRNARTALENAGIDSSCV